MFSKLFLNLNKGKACLLVKDLAKTGCQFAIAYELAKCFQVSTAIGDSMFPTIENGDILFISKIPLIFNLLKNKDIVVAKSFTSNNELVCK